MRENGDRSPFCAAFIAAPYIGTLNAGCRVARISTIIAGPIINPKGARSIARNCWFPYLGAARFYCLLSRRSGMAGRGPLHRPRWRINDPAIRGAPSPFLIVFAYTCISVCAVYIRITPRVRRDVRNRSRARKEPAKRTPHARY